MVVSVVGGGEKFSDGEISKTTTVGPLQFSHYTVLLPKAPVQSNMDAQHSIASPDPQQKVSTTLYQQTNKRKRASKRANIRPPLTPRAIAHGACGHSPLITKYYLAA